MSKLPPFPRPLPQAREEQFRPCGLWLSNAIMARQG